MKDESPPSLFAAPLALQVLSCGCPGRQFRGGVRLVFFLVPPFACRLLLLYNRCAGEGKGGGRKEERRRERRRRRIEGEEEKVEGKE